MHLLVSHAAPLAPEMLQAVDALALPNLQRLLAALTLGQRNEGDESSLSTSQERVLARLFQWPVEDGLLPFAAQAAAQDGLDVFESFASGGVGWGLLSPTYWHLGTERVALSDPADLALDEAASRGLYDAVAPLFIDDGWRLHWGAPTRWYAVHESLTRLPTASLDRVIGRNIDLWLGKQGEAKRLRRLQAEVQMLLHTHPINQTREAARLAPINSVWLSGTGAPRKPAAVSDLQFDDSLRGAALAGDGAGWAAAWQRLDAGPLQVAWTGAQEGRDISLTLCGERHAQTWSTPPRGRLRRWFGTRPSVATALGAL